MTAAVAAVAGLLTVGMAWRGYRRGAVATLAGWTPMLAGGLVLLLAARLAWAHPGRFVAFSIAGLSTSFVTFIGGSLALWAWRRRHRRGLPSLPGRWEGEGWTSDPVHPTLPVPSLQGRGGRAGGWLGLGNRVGGAALGVVATALLCLALACLASLVPFAFGLTAAPERGDGSPAPTPKWLAVLGSACCTMAEVADASVLDHIPRLRTYGREVRALIVLLNAPRQKLERIARKRDLARLAQAPEVRRALLDEDYLDLIDRLRTGDLAALQALADSPVTREVFKCPEIRAAASRLTLSALAKDLDDAPPATQ